MAFSRTWACTALTRLDLPSPARPKAARFVCRQSSGELRGVGQQRIPRTSTLQQGQIRPLLTVLNRRQMVRALLPDKGPRHIKNRGAFKRRRRAFSLQRRCDNVFYIGSRFTSGRPSCSSNSARIGVIISSVHNTRRHAVVLSRLRSTRVQRKIEIS